MRHVEPSHLLTRLLLVTLAVTLLGSAPAAETARVAEARLQADLDVVRAFRPAYPFWQHIFTIPDGRIAFGSARRRPAAGDLPFEGGLGNAGAVWPEPDLGTALARRQMAGPRGRPPRPGDRSPGAGPRVRCCTTRRAGSSCSPTSRNTAPSLASGAHLRALRRPGGHRPRPGGSRVRAERHGPVAGQRPGAVPVAPAQLAGTWIASRQ